MQWSTRKRNKVLGISDDLDTLQNPHSGATIIYASTMIRFYDRIPKTYLTTYLKDLVIDTKLHLIDNNPTIKTTIM